MWVLGHLNSKLYMNYRHPQSSNMVDWGPHLIVSTACITVVHSGTQCKPDLGIYHRSFINNKMKMSYVFLLWFLFLLFFRLLQNKTCKKISIHVVILLKGISGVFKPFNFPNMVVNKSLPKNLCKKKFFCMQSLKYICMYKPCFF